ncbi:MAG: hypothetical protein LC098_10580 [Burkholderiales bacterium]|uniref:hypothetical protein n=1 Tax=Dokdonella sp. TaxID=2291710 RepID=UPI0027BA3034|nr:hypothetical protein [Dokdonella sp.]MCZ2135854.1 hypothetical protein [Burkholderiales bacterium]
MHDPMAGEDDMFARHAHEVPFSEFVRTAEWSCDLFPRPSAMHSVPPRHWEIHYEIDGEGRSDVWDMNLRDAPEDALRAWHHSMVVNAIEEHEILLSHADLALLDSKAAQRLVWFMKALREDELTPDLVLPLPTSEVVSEYPDLKERFHACLIGFPVRPSTSTSGYRLVLIDRRSESAGVAVAVLRTPKLRLVEADGRIRRVEEVSMFGGSYTLHDREFYNSALATIEAERLFHAIADTPEGLWRPASGIQPFALDGHKLLAMLTSGSFKTEAP